MIDASAFLLHMESTGTRYGSTYHQRLLSCVRREYHYQQRLAGFGVTEETTEASENLIRGSAYHLMQRKWREGTFQEIVFPDNDLPTPQMKGLKDACRQFAAYRKRFPDGLWPTLAVEEPLGVSEAEQAKLGTLLPHVRASGQIDLRTEIVDDIQAARISDTLGFLILPGRYLVDFKSGGYFDEKKLEILKWSLQGRMYMVLYNILRPETPVQGIIYDCITGHADKTPKYPKGIGPQSVFVMKYLSSQDEAFVLEYWADLAKQRERLEAGDLVANKSACFSGHDVCAYLGKECDQMHKQIEVTK